MQLSRAEKEEIVKAKAELARRHLLNYCMYVDDRYDDPPHLKLLCDALEKVERGEIKRLMVFMPPRHGKSETVSRKFPAWYLGRNPRNYVIHSSYGEELSRSFSRVVRNQMESRRYKTVFNVSTGKDSRAVSDWVTSQDGGFLSSGVGGAITGRGAHLYIIDDPVKNQEEAESETMREKVWEWYKSTAFTRLEPGAAMVMIQTRWHQQDLSGKLLEQQRKRDLEGDSDLGDEEDWLVINLPAVAEDEEEDAEEDALGREVGEPLWENRYNAKKLANIKFNVGSRIWYALYQGRPMDPESQIIRRKWIEWYDVAPLRCVRGGGIDTATSEKTTADNMALVDVLKSKQGFMYVDDVFLEKTSVRVFSEHVVNRQLTKETRYQKINHEDNNAGNAIRQDIQRVSRKRRAHVPIVGFTTTRDKTIRMHEIAPLIENGTIKFKRGNKKVTDLVEHLVTFPQGKVDDDCDGLYFAVQALSGMYHLKEVGKGTKKEGKKPLVNRKQMEW